MSAHDAANQNKPKDPMTDLTTAERAAESLRSNKTLTWVIYGLYAASFVVGITGIAAIIMNYVKRGDVAGTYLESHFTWQIIDTGRFDTDSGVKDLKSRGRRHLEVLQKLLNQL